MALKPENNFGAAWISSAYDYVDDDHLVPSVELSEKEREEDVKRVDAIQTALWATARSESGAVLDQAMVELS